MASKAFAIVMWKNENGHCSVVSVSEIFTNDAKERLIIGKEYTVKYGEDNFQATLKMLGFLFFFY